MVVHFDIIEVVGWNSSDPQIFVLFLTQFLWIPVNPRIKSSGKIRDNGTIEFATDLKFFK